MVYITRYAIKKETFKRKPIFLKKHQNSYHIGSTKGFAQFSQRNFHLHPDGGDINILLFRNFAVRFAFIQARLKNSTAFGREFLYFPQNDLVHFTAFQCLQWIVGRKNMISRKAHISSICSVIMRSLKAEDRK